MIKVSSWSAACGHCKITLTLNETKFEREFDWSFGQFKERLAANILELLGVGLAWVGDSASPAYARAIVVGRGIEMSSIEAINGNVVKAAWFDVPTSAKPVVFAGDRMFVADVEQTLTSAVFAAGTDQEDDAVNSEKHPTLIGGVRYDF